MYKQRHSLEGLQKNLNKCLHHLHRHTERQLQVFERQSQNKNRQIQHHTKQCTNQKKWNRQEA